MKERSADRHLTAVFNQVMIGVSIAAFFVHVIFLYAFYQFGVTELFYFNIASIAIFVVGTILSLRQYTATAFALTCVEVTAHAITATYFIGWDTGFHFYIILLIPVVLFGPRNFWTTKLPLNVAVCVIYLCMEFQFKFNSVPAYDLDTAVVSTLHLANSAISLLFLSFLCGIYNLVVRQSSGDMYRLANTDALSGLKNRRSITATIDRELDKQLAQKKLKPEMHFVICDIDYFKRINDTHGHDAGDQVIRSIAELIQNHSPRPDFCARWGGEEFLIVFPNASRQDVLAEVEALRERIQKTLIIHEDKTLNVTMTFGVCSMRRKETAADSIDRADKALYAGKQTGRNKVVFANE